MWAWKRQEISPGPGLQQRQSAASHKQQNESSFSNRLWKFGGWRGERKNTSVLPKTWVIKPQTPTTLNCYCSLQIKLKEICTPLLQAWTKAKSLWKSGQWRATKKSWFPNAISFLVGKTYFFRRTMRKTLGFSFGAHTIFSWVSINPVTMTCVLTQLSHTAAL